MNSYERIKENKYYVWDIEGDFKTLIAITDTAEKADYLSKASNYFRLNNYGEAESPASPCPPQEGYVITGGHFVPSQKIKSIDEIINASDGYFNRDGKERYDRNNVVGIATSYANQFKSYPPQGAEEWLKSLASGLHFLTEAITKDDQNLTDRRRMANQAQGYFKELQEYASLNQDGGDESAGDVKSQYELFTEII